MKVGLFLSLSIYGVKSIDFKLYIILHTHTHYKYIFLMFLFIYFFGCTVGLARS